MRDAVQEEPVLLADDLGGDLQDGADALIERATTLTKVVSDPTRLRILSALALEELCVCDLAVIAGINESTMSHQLRHLRALGLVTFKKVGRIAYYRLANDHTTRLIADMLAHARVM